MLSRIVHTGLRSRILFLLVAFALLIVALVRLEGSRVEALPEFAPVTVEVQAEALGLSAQEVEDLVTTPLESNLLSGVAWVESLRSASLPGLSSVVMTFEPGTDVVRARQVVQERLTQGALLTNASKAPVMLQPTSASNRVVMMSVASTTQSLMDLSVLSRWTLRPKLMSVPGVAGVAIWGMRDRQLQVRADPDRMAARGVSLDEVVASTGNALWVSPLSYLRASTPGRGGFIDLPQQRVSIQHISPISTAASLGSVAVEGRTDGTLLSDVATVVEDVPAIIGDGVVGDGSGIVLVVEKQPDASSVDVTRGIEEAIEALRIGLPGVTLDTSGYSATTYASDLVRNLILAAAVVLILLAVAVGFAARSWRAPVVVTLSTLATLAVGWLLLDLRDGAVNLLLVTGLFAAAFVGVAQSLFAVNTVAAMPEGSDRKQRLQTALTSTATGAVYAALAAIAVTVPIYLLNGRAGALMSDMASGYVVGTIVALIVSLAVVTPLVGILYNGAPVGATDSGAPLTRRYQNWLRRGSGFAVMASLLGVVVLAVLVSQVGVDTRPQFNERTLVVAASAPPGTSPAFMARSLGALGADIQALEGVSTVTGHLGRAVQGDRAVGTDEGELWVTVSANADRTRVADEVGRVAARSDTLRTDVGSYLSGRADAHLPDAPKPLVVSVYGPSAETLEASAKQVLEQVRSVRGVVNPVLVTEPTEETVQISVDGAKAQALGLSPGDVRREAATLVGGLEVGSIFEGQKVYDVQVWSSASLRDDPAKLEALPINTLEGRRIRLGQVATIKTVEQPRVIRREAVQRRLDIVADVDGRSAGAVRDELTGALQQMKLPSEYHAEVRTEASAIESNHRWMVVYAIAAAVMLLLLVQATTGNWAMSLVVLGSLPLALVGGVIAGVFLGDLTIGAILGLIALIGLAVALSLDVIATLRTGDGRPGIDDVTAKAHLIAKRGLLVCTAVALPAIGLIILGARPGLEAIRDLAVVMLGGAVTTAIVALLVTPVAYARFGRRNEDAADLRIDVPNLRTEGGPAHG